MKKIFDIKRCLRVAMAVAIIAVSGMFGVTARAGQPTAALTSLADKLQTECPIDVVEGWTIQMVCVEDNETNIVMVVDTPDKSRFAQMKGNPEAVKSRFIKALSERASRQGSLVAETMASGFNLVVDIISPTGDDTLTLTFTPAELRGK